MTDDEDGPANPSTADADDESSSPTSRWWSLAQSAFWASWAVVLALVVGTVGGATIVWLTIHGWPQGADDTLEKGDYLVVLSGKDDGVGGQRQRLIDTWNRLHPDQKARIEELPSTADDQRTEMLRQAQSDDPRDNVDVYNLDVTWTAEFAAAEAVRELRDANLDGFLANPLRTCRYEGKVWALPFNTDAGLLFFRPEPILKAVGRKAWDEEIDPGEYRPSWLTIKRAFEYVVASSNPANQNLKAAYTGQFDDYEGLTVNVMEAVWAEGGEVVNAQNEITLGSDPSRRGIRSLAQGFTDSSMILDEARQQQEAESTAAFKDEKVLFMRNWPVAYRQLIESGTDPGTTAGGFGVTRLPGPSALGGQNLAIADKSRHPKAARELIEFLTDEASQQILFEAGGFASTRERTYRDPAIQSKYTYAQTLLDAVNDARLRPVTPYYSAFSKAFRELVEQVLNTGDEITAEQLETLQRSLKGKVTP